MPFIRTTLLAAGALSLASCAGDNPDNVPLYGNWEMTTKLGSFSIDGRVVPPEMLPPEMKALVGSEKRCGEPMFINREWQEDDINRRVRGDCKLDEYEVTSTRVTGKGTCANIAPGADFNPGYSIDIAQSPERYRMTIEMKGDATIAGAAGRHVIRVSAIQTGVRTGDC